MCHYDSNVFLIYSCLALLMIPVEGRVVFLPCQVFHDLFVPWEVVVLVFLYSSSLSLVFPRHMPHSMHSCSSHHFLIPPFFPIQSLPVLHTEPFKMYYIELAPYPTCRQSVYICIYLCVCGTYSVWKFSFCQATYWTRNIQQIFLSEINLQTTSLLVTRIKHTIHHIHFT